MKDWNWKLFVYLAKFVWLSIFKMNCNQEEGGVLQKKNQNKQVKVRVIILNAIYISLSRKILKTENI